MQPQPTSAAQDFDSLVLEAEKLCERRNAEAIKLIDKADEIATASGDLRKQSMVSYIRAFHDCFISNNYESAIQRLNQALADLDEVLFPAIGYKLLMTLGNSYQLKGDLFSAQESYLRGMKSLDAKPNLSSIEKSFFAAFYYNLSILLSASELKIESEEYLEKAMNIYSELGNRFKLSECHVAYAQMLERKQDFPKAIEHLNRALEIGETINDPYSIALAMANLGILAIKSGDHAKAPSYLKTALHFYETNKMSFETGMVKFELGQALVESGDWDQGIQYITDGEALMAQLDNKKELAEIFRYKSSILARRGRHGEAYDYLLKYTESLKFFFDNEKTNALTRARNEFESEQKEKEAKFLREKNEEIQNYALKLEASNNELKQFANVASHDLKEPLRMINSYLHLIKKSLHNSLTEQQNEFFNYAVDGAKRMDKMIQDLLRLAKVDANPRIEPVKLMNVIEEIKLNLDTLIKEKKARVTASDLPVIHADRTQMIQLFQNLIANGINYNTSGSPVITILGRQNREQLEITVADNGVGIPENFKQAAFEIFKSMPNQTTHNGTGIGLSICKKIVEKMGGKIRIEDKTEGGSIFRITFYKSIVKAE